MVSVPLCSAVLHDEIQDGTPSFPEWFGLMKLNTHTHKKRKKKKKSGENVITQRPPKGTDNGITVLRTASMCKK